MNKSASFSQDKAKYLGILSLKNIRRINDLAKIKVDKKYSEEKERIINVLHQYFEEISSIVNSDTWKDYYKYTAIGLDLGIQNVEARIAEMKDGKDFSRALYIYIPNQENGARARGKNYENIRRYCYYKDGYGLKEVSKELDFSSHFYGHHDRLHADAKYMSEIWLYSPIFNGVLHFNYGLEKECDGIVKKFFSRYNEHPNSVEVIMRINDGRYIGMQKIDGDICVMERFNGEWTIPQKPILKSQLKTGTLTRLY